MNEIAQESGLVKKQQNVGSQKTTNKAQRKRNNHSHNGNRTKTNGKNAPRSRRKHQNKNRQFNKDHGDSGRSDLGKQHQSQTSSDDISSGPAVQQQHQQGGQTQHQQVVQAHQKPGAQNGFAHFGRQNQQAHQQQSAPMAGGMQMNDPRLAYGAMNGQMMYGHFPRMQAPQLIMQPGLQYAGMPEMMSPTGHQNPGFVTSQMMPGFQHAFPHITQLQMNMLSPTGANAQQMRFTPMMTAQTQQQQHTLQHRQHHQQHTLQQQQGGQAHPSHTNPFNLPQGTFSSSDLMPDTSNTPLSLPHTLSQSQLSSVSSQAPSPNPPSPLPIEVETSNHVSTGSTPIQKLRMQILKFQEEVHRLTAENQSLRLENQRLRQQAISLANQV